MFQLIYLFSKGIYEAVAIFHIEMLNIFKHYRWLNLLPYTSLMGTVCTLQFRLSKVFGKCCHQLINHVPKFLNILNDYFICDCGKNYCLFPLLRCLKWKWHLFIQFYCSVLGSTELCTVLVSLSNTKLEYKCLNKLPVIFPTSQEVWILFLLALIQWLAIINVFITVIF